MVVVSTNKENDMNESTLVPREEISDLDWLARNVHVWPTSTPHIVPAGDSVFEFGVTFFDNHACVYHREHADSEIIHKKQWLSRRAKLHNKPGWANHQWPQIFQNEDGHWFGVRSAWDFKAHIGGGWKGEGVSLLRDDGEYLQSGEILGDWRDTLENRPETNEIPAHINQPKPSTDIPGCAEVKQFDPFVSVEDAATAKQPAPKGSGNPILGMVLADLTNRALEGKEKYGEPLLAHNGRNPLWDAYQEALDLAMYLRQAIEERK